MLLRGILLENRATFSSESVIFMDGIHVERLTCVGIWTREVNYGFARLCQFVVCCRFLTLSQRHCQL
jgi:hypothetical protein